MDTIDNGFEGDATLGVSLWVKEDFCMDNLILLTSQKIGPGQIIEVLLGLQNVGA